MRLIDADELLTAFPIDDEPMLTKSCVRMTIKRMPTIEKKGTWLDRSNGGRILYPWWKNYECDKCGYYGHRAWKFCPKCGADMRGEDEG